MLRRTVLSAMLLMVVAGCSKSPERATSALPTAPTPQANAGADRTPMGVGGVSGAMDVLFPSRGDSFEFRNQLETKYQTGLNRDATSTFVDREGEVVWVQEYMRYRVNGCDHAGASQRVFAQIDGNPPAAICAENPGGLVTFPPRSEALAFRQDLEVKYQQMSRAASSSFVDAEGGVIWTQEYIRYRTNACDHQTSVQKVFSQIDGGGVAATCYVPPCSYWLRYDVTEVGAASGNRFVDLFANTPGCAWTATSDSSWLTVSAPTTGTEEARVPFSFTTNSGPFRTGTIRFDWSGGSARHRVEQAASGLNSAFTLTDSWRSSNVTTDCRINTSATPCTLTASATVISATYAWRVEYLYPNLVTHTQTGTSNVFTFTQQCGGSTATATGFSTPMTVTLTVTDTDGSTQTITSGSGSQPGLTISLFSC